ncbi:MAG: hypothetical protein COB51_04320 [Moraxellaceae bacterium]|nr:MAG: hypothetical protein COB51_04320 [Moraxellaceae bacterium]
MNLYEKPNADLNNEKLSNKRRSLFFLIILNVYYWPKLIGFSSRYIDYILTSDYQTILSMGINLPVYLAVGLLIFRVKLFNSIFWKIWVLLAIADEIRFQIVNYVNIELLIYETLLLSPLYAAAVIYAYFSGSIWQLNVRMWGRVKV